MEQKRFRDMIDKKRLVDTFFELLKIKSPSKDEKKIADYLERNLKGLGLEVINDNTGEIFGSNSGNIIAQNKDFYDKDREAIFLAAHMDTVALNGEVIPKIVEGRIINDNADCVLGGDDKIALAAILEALRIIDENDIETGKMYIIITTAEEIGILGAKALDIGSIEAEYGIVFDAEGDIGVINNQAPYHNYIKIEITGRSAHAGIEPEKGINSILIASEAISKLKIGRIDDKTTANVGKIDGGRATNIVPEKVLVECEARSLIEDRLEEVTKNIVETFKTVTQRHKAKLDVKTVREYDGFYIPEDDYSILLAKKAIRALGIEPKLEPTGGGSDINIFNARGKRSVNLSSGMESVHSNEEFVKLEQLYKLAELILNICAIKL